MRFSSLPSLLAALCFALPAQAAASDLQLAVIGAGGANRSDPPEREAAETRAAPPRSKSDLAPSPYPAMLKVLLRPHETLKAALDDDGGNVKDAFAWTTKAVLEIHVLVGNPDPLTIDAEPFPRHWQSAVKRRAALAQLEEARAMLQRSTAGGEHRTHALNYIERAIASLEKAR